MFITRWSSRSPVQLQVLDLRLAGSTTEAVEKANLQRMTSHECPLNVSYLQLRVSFGRAWRGFPGNARALYLISPRRPLNSGKHLFRRSPNTHSSRPPELSGAPRIGPDSSQFMT